MNKLSAWPHQPTPTGSTVELANPEYAGQPFRVLSSFITDAHTVRPKTAYLLSDADGKPVTALNGWKCLDSWLSDRLEALRVLGAEETALREALRVAAGEQ